MARGAQFGRARERAVAEHERALGWVVLKGTSFGVCDLIALKAGERPRLIEVKGVRRPYDEFEPEARAKLSAAAEQAGADAFLAHWPAGGQLRMIPESEWPRSRRRDPAGT